MLNSLTPEDVKRIALIHSKALIGDFLPSLGINFLSTFYSGVLLKKGVYGFGEKENGKIVGFVLGTRDSSGLFLLALKSKFLQLSFLLALQIIKKPKLIKNVLETFLYTSKEVGPKAELVVIAVLNKMQGKGIGKKLIAALENVFIKDSIKEYKLTVHADKSAVQFYEHLNYKRIAEFKLYDKIWYVYAKSLRFDEAKRYAKKIKNVKKQRLSNSSS